MIPTTWQTIASDEDYHQRQMLDQLVKDGKITRAEQQRRIKERDAVRAEYRVQRV